MRIWTIIKILAALAVCGVIAFTCLLAYHVTVKPVGGIFEKLIPEPSGIKKHESSDTEFAKMVESSKMPDSDPGEQAFQKAYELLALGQIPEAREKLTSLFNAYPNSSAAPTSKQIVGEMNIDELLSSRRLEEKSIHTVQKGDSYSAIAAKYQTTIDCIVQVNSMMELRPIQPGDEIIVMPLNFRLLIEPHRKSISLWKSGKFIREYSAISMAGVPTTPCQTTISSKIAEADGKRIVSHSPEFRGAHKSIQLAKPNVTIRAATDAQPAENATGIILKPQDMEEIALLTRIGNEVEIR